jgi:hypothetical protein
LQEAGRELEATCALAALDQHRLGGDLRFRAVPILWDFRPRSDRRSVRVSPEFWPCNPRSITIGCWKTGIQGPIANSAIVSVVTVALSLALGYWPYARAVRIRGSGASCSRSRS